MQSPVKKHDRDHVIQERVREHKNTNWQDWTACEMYGHEYNESGTCNCGEQQQ